MTTHSSVLLRESHRLKSLAGHSPWSCKELDATEATKHACVHICHIIYLTGRSYPVHQLSISLNKLPQNVMT